MAIATYSDLKAKIGRYLARSGMDAEIADAIEMFEDRYNASEDNYFAEAATTINSVAGNAFVELPADFNEHVSLTYADGTPISIVALSALGFSNTKGRPLRAAIYPDNRLKFEVVPAAVYEIELVYEANLASLSDSNASNWLLAKYRYVYVYGALMFMLDYLRDGVRAETIGVRNREFLSEIQGKKAIRKLGSTPVMQTPRGMP